MNAGITISFAIGGFLLISIITLNSRVIENSGESALNISAKQTVETISQVMTRDFLRIGYNTGNAPNEAIIEISPAKIVFEADLDNDGSESPVRITWEAMPGQKIISTKNDRDYELTRTVDSGPEAGTSTFAVTELEFTFLDEDGISTMNKKKVRSVRVSLASEAPARYGRRSDYEKSVWNKTVTPPNLNLAAYQ